MPHLKAGFRAAGIYVITTVFRGKEVTNRRWVNRPDELERLLGQWRRRGYRVLKVAYLGR